MVQGGRKVAEAASRGVSDGDRTDRHGAAAGSGPAVCRTAECDYRAPWTARRQSIGFVRVHRTRRMPGFSRTGPIRFASPARAVADAAHGFSKLDEVRALVAEGVQRQACSIAQLGLELTGGVNRDSLHLRTALAEVRDGIRSVAEARFRQRVRNSDLPQPVRHPPPSLRTDPDRQRLARVAEAGYAKRPRRMPGPLTLGPVRWSPPRREAHRGSSRTVFREGDIRCGPGDPSRTGHCL